MNDTLVFSSYFSPSSPSFVLFFIPSNKRDDDLSKTNPKMTNRRMIGKRTKNQLTSLCPALQIEFRTKVQNKIYTALNTNIIKVFGT